MVGYGSNPFDEYHGNVHPCCLLKNAKNEHFIVMNVKHEAAN